MKRFIIYFVTHTLLETTFTLWVNNRQENGGSPTGIIFLTVYRQEYTDRDRMTEKIQSCRLTDRIIFPVGFFLTADPQDKFGSPASKTCRDFFSLWAARQDNIVKPTRYYLISCRFSNRKIGHADRIFFCFLPDHWLKMIIKWQENYILTVLVAANRKPLVTLKDVSQTII